ncbi:MAG: alanine racemase [Desulfobulbaceae bacterium]|nr:alanine racemase [Desulfobulbaceae bacterium]
MTPQLTWIEIDLAALKSNCRFLRSRAGEKTELLAVVKSEAYGHGMEEVACCLHDEGIRAFGVSAVSEGVRLRRKGISGLIVVFLWGGRDLLADVVEHDLQPVVFAKEQLLQISEAAVCGGSKIGVHIKVDTGMGRLGMLPDELPAFLHLVTETPGVYPAGIMSHPPLADGESTQFAEDQNQLFKSILDAVCGDEDSVPLAHIANSAALLRFPDMHWDMVRPGIAIYGCRPLAGGLFADAELAPVMSFKTRVLQVKDVPVGFGVSYGHTFTTSRPSRLAVLPVGYSNGYSRSLSNRVDVLLHGRRAPQVGRICMNVTVVDVTDLEQVRAGDEVVLMGRQGDEEISVDEIAALMGTINYEVVCLLGNNNPRIYIN